MTCPYCNHVFPLTWRRYLSEPGAKHRCPNCQKFSRLPWSISYFTLLILAQSIAGVPLAAYADFKFGGYWPLAGWIVGAFLTGTPIDKMILDEKYRALQRLDDDAS